MRNLGEIIVLRGKTTFDVKTIPARLQLEVFLVFSDPVKSLDRCFAFRMDVFVYIFIFVPICGLCITLT